MKLLKLDKKFASEYFQGKDYNTIKNFKIYSCDFGFVIKGERGDYILTNSKGVLLYTNAKK